MQTRFDRSAFKMKKTKEGYYNGKAVVTKTGVFQYLNADGTICRELRHADDVLKTESLDTLKLKPVTNDHPNELVNVDNVDKYSVGSIGETVEVHGNNIVVAFTVNNKDAVMAIESNKKRELSLGYTLDLIQEDGIYNGEVYTHRQTNINYNHLAIVERGRAGRDARINMDGYAVQVVVDEAEEVSVMTDNLQSLRVDGLEYKASPEVVKHLEKQTALRLDAEKALVEAKANVDSLQAKLDETVKAKNEAEAKVNSDAIAYLVASHVELLGKAGRVVNVDSLASKSAREVQEFVIKAKNADMDLSEKSDDYVSARFDAIIEALPSKDEEALNKQREQLHSINTDKKEDVAMTPDAQIAQLNALRGGGK
jgi:hypothetical protein